MDQKKSNIKRTLVSQANSPISRLIGLGRSKSYVTYGDILQVIPQPEHDLGYLDLVFATLIAAKIPYIDEQG